MMIKTAFTTEDYILELARQSAIIVAQEDKIEGLETELDLAVEVAFKRGAVEWTRLNFPKIYKRLTYNA